MEGSSRKRELSEHCTKLTRTTPNEEPTSTEATTLCGVLGARLRQLHVGARAPSGVRHTTETERERERASARESAKA